MADLSLTNIHKSFGDTKVIHGVDLEVDAMDDLGVSEGFMDVRQAQIGH